MVPRGLPHPTISRFPDTHLWHQIHLDRATGTLSSCAQFQFYKSLFLPFVFYHSKQNAKLIAAYFLVVVTVAEK